MEISSWDRMDTDTQSKRTVTTPTNRPLRLSCCLGCLGCNSFHFSFSCFLLASAQFTILPLNETGISLLTFPQ